VTAGLVLLLYAIVLWVEKRRPPWREIASGATIAIVGLPFVARAYLISTENPAFAAWSAQNQTPSPPPWDYVVAYGIVLALAVFGIWTAARRRRDSDWLLLIWVACTVVLLYLPFSLQRRFMMGLIVPLGLLATIGYYSSWHWRLRPTVVWAIAGLTSLFVIVISLFGALARNPALYLTQDERAALSWLEANAPADALVIAAPQTGLYIPAWAGQRVYYGHRFDSADADLRRGQLIAFYADGERSLLEEPPATQPDYVLFGPRERALSGDGWRPDPTWEQVYQQGDVTLYALPQG
jgi:hypothetical protein